MDKGVAIGFYIVLGIVGIAAAWLLDSGQNQAKPTDTTDVKQQSIQLNADDFDEESPDLRNAVDRLMQPVQKPGSDSTLNQLQPAAGNSDAQQTPQ